MPTVTTRNLIAAMVAIREEESLALVEELLAAGTDPHVVLESCREAMAVIGSRFETGTAFIPELIMAGDMMADISSKVRPHLGDGGDSWRGRLVLGTVRGDIHDIGKNIVCGLLEASGFDVLDLGVDVPPERFVNAVREAGPCAVALSCLLTAGFDSMRATVQAIDAAGLRAQASVMIGGAPITADVCEYVGADGWGDDAATALRLATRWSDGGDA